MGLLRRYPLVSFVALAYAVTWSAQIAAILISTRTGVDLSNESNMRHFFDVLSGVATPNQAVAYWLFTLGAGPLIAGIIMTAVCDGRAGLRTLWERCTQWKVPIRWYIVVLGVPVAMGLASLALGLLTAGGSIDYKPRAPVALAVPFFLYMLIFTGVAEEPGWRGFALPRLQQRYTAEKASWILGPIWGIWHLPFIAYYNRGQGLALMAAALVGLTIGIVGWTMVNTWVFNSTGSVWMIILLHGWGNTVQSYLVLSTNNLAVQSLYTLLPWGIALLLLKRYGVENLADTHRVT